MRLFLLYESNKSCIFFIENYEVKMLFIQKNEKINL